MNRFYLTLLLLLLSTNIGKADEAEKGLPLWEAGIAVGAASLPHYMGSDERYLFAAPIPYLIYRGEHLKIDRRGITGELFGVRNLSADASLGVGLPVRNSNRARAGMPGLKFSFQAGPRLNWAIHEDEDSKITLRLPWRGIIDSSGSWLGWVSEPDFKIDQKVDAKLQLTLAAGLLYGSQRFHNTYYSVAPVYATATRPAYQARDGLHSLSLTGTVRYQFSDSITLFSAIRYRNLAAGVIADSPLVKDKNYILATVGLAWSFWMSEEEAAE